MLRVESRNQVSPSEATILPLDACSTQGTASPNQKPPSAVKPEPQPSATVVNQTTYSAINFVIPILVVFSLMMISTVIFGAVLVSKKSIKSGSSGATCGIVTCSGLPNSTRLINTCNCHKFYQCLSNIAYSFDCPNGTYFQNSTDSCESDANETCS